MELRQLRYFVATAEELHFGRAARRLHVAQPALSQQILKLERELGVLLLARTRRRVSLTEPGRAFLAEARRTLASAGHAVEAARRAAAGETGQLRIGYVEWSVYLFLPAILRRYRERYPEVELEISELHREPQREALSRGDLDLGFFAFRPGEADFSTELLAEDPLVAVLPEHHPAGQLGSVPLEALKTEPWVLFPRELQTVYLEVVLRACAAAGFLPRVVQEAGQLNTVAALVSAGLGVSLLPQAFANLPRPHVTVRPLTGPPPMLLHHAVWRSDALSPAAASFLAIAREVRDARRA